LALISKIKHLQVGAQSHKKKSCRALARWERPLQNNNTRSYFEIKNNRCHIKTNRFKTNYTRSHLNTDPSNQWAF
jgi:hypothetical protein